MKFYSLRFDYVIWRFYLMMVIVIAPFYAGVPALAILALPLFLSIMVGLSFDSKRPKKTDAIKSTKHFGLDNTKKLAA
jgi:hypothetical protein